MTIWTIRLIAYLTVFVTILALQPNALSQDPSSVYKLYDPVKKVVIEHRHFKSPVVALSAEQQAAIARRQKEKDQEGQNGSLRAERLRENMNRLQDGFHPSRGKAGISATPKAEEITIDSLEIEKLYGSGIREVSCESCRCELEAGSTAFNMTGTKYGPLVCVECRQIHDVHVNGSGKVDSLAWKRKVGIAPNPTALKSSDRGSIEWQIEELKYAPTGKDGYVTEGAFKAIRSGTSNFAPRKPLLPPIKIEIVTDPEKVKQIKELLESLDSLKD